MDRRSIAGRLDAYERLIRLDKPIGTLLLLWPTLWAVWLASRRPGRSSTSCSSSSSARCSCARPAAPSTTTPTATSIAHVERTRDRPLAAGEIQPREALLVAARARRGGFHASSCSSIGCAILLSFVALAIAVDVSVHQALLRAAAGDASASRSASASRWPTRRSRSGCRSECWVLFAANLFYSFAYDTEYAMVDRDDDARLGHPHLGAHARPLGRRRGDGELCDDAGDSALPRLRSIAFAGRITPASRCGGGDDALPLVADPRSQPRGRFKAFRHDNWVGAAIFVGIFFALR